MYNPENEQIEPLLWIDVEFNDYEQFNEAAKDWHIDFHQLDGDTFHSRVQQVILPKVQIGHTQLDSHLDQKGTSPKDMWSFVILGKESSMFNFNHEMTQSTSTMLIYSPGHIINAVSTSGFEIYVFSVERTHLGKIAASLGLNKIEEKLSKIDRVELHEDQANRLREQLQNILTSVFKMEDKVSTAQEREMFLKLLPTQFFKALLQHMDCAPLKVFKHKHLSYMEARAYMHTNLYQPISIDGIAKKFDILERTLRNHFQEELGISPKQYLNTIRLQRVRNELKNKKEKVNIEAVARKFGFNHMGQFSKAYKEFFGELPSQTLSCS
jgi:AraC-like DNA-binding protein